MRQPIVAVLVASLLVAGCGDSGASAKRSGTTGPAKGAKVRVFNMGPESFETLLNGLTYGRPLEPQTASPFKRTSSKKPAQVMVKAGAGDEEPAVVEGAVVSLDAVGGAVHGDSGLLTGRGPVAIGVVVGDD